MLRHQELLVQHCYLRSRLQYLKIQLQESRWRTRNTIQNAKCVQFLCQRRLEAARCSLRLCQVTVIQPAQQHLNQVQQVAVEVLAS